MNNWITAYEIFEKLKHFARRIRGNTGDGSEEDHVLNLS